MGGALLAALAIGMLAVPEADAHGKGGGHSGGGGRAPRPPRVSAPRQNYQAPRASRSAAASHANNARSQATVRNAQGHTNNAQARVKNAQVRANNTPARTNNTQAHANNAQAHANRSQANLTNAQARATNNATVATRSSILGTANPTTTGTNTLATGTRTNGTYFPNTYSYGSGARTRALRAYGYGRGYRNSYYGRRYGYGRSQGNNRAIISRLRSVHSSLARIDHDYQGHRSRAMHAISMAIRQLSNRSMSYGNTGFASGMNNVQAMGMRQGGLGGGMRQGGLGGGGGRGGQPMTQAQSDSRMSQDLRALQGINMQLNNQGYNTTGHARARGHIQHAIHELNVALSIR